MGVVMAQVMLVTGVTHPPVPAVNAVNRHNGCTGPGDVGARFVSSRVRSSDPVRPTHSEISLPHQ